MQVDPEDILDPGIEQQDCPMLLNLHDGILLQERTIKDYFSYFSTKTYIVDTQKNHLNEMVL